LKKKGTTNDLATVKVLSPPHLLFVVFCCVFCSGGLLLAQTSPKGAFKIETATQGDEPEGRPVSAFVVSTSDPNVKEPLDEHPVTNAVKYYVSPDEKWIFEELYYGHGMTGGQLYKRGEGLKFQEVRKTKSFSDLAWLFLAEKEQLKGDDLADLQSEEGGDPGIMDFVAWSPDSGRLLVDLRGGGFGGERSRGVYKWYLYFNTRTQSFELTDYLVRLNKDAWKRWKNFGDKAPIFPEAASAEPLGELAPQAEQKKRYEETDRRLNEVYQQVLNKIDKEQKASLREDQRDWIKTRDMGTKLYKESGDKSTAERRYWQYMLDSAEAQLRHLENDWKPEIE
jgi:uncharacterized protein YecT (DUF1311 family)